MVVGSSEIHIGLVIAGIVGITLELVSLFGPGLRSHPFDRIRTFSRGLCFVAVTSAD